MRVMKIVNAAACLAAVLAFVACRAEQAGRPAFSPSYAGNRPPLRQPAYLRLPLGAVKPEGWLGRQLALQARGLTGYVDDFYLTDSRWKGGGDRNPVPGTRDSWAVQYLNGLVAVAHLIEDARLKGKAQEYIDWILGSARPDGWFGPPWEQGYEENTVCDPGHLKGALAALILHHEATGDERVLPLAAKFLEFLRTNVREWPPNKWWGMGAMGTAPLAYWVYNATGDARVLDYVKDVWAGSFDYVGFYQNFPWDERALEERRIPWNWTAKGKTAHGPLIAGGLAHPGQWFLLSGEESARDGVTAGIRNLEAFHGQAGGRFSGDEHISGRRPTQGTELCGVIGTMDAMESLFSVFGDPALADRLEALAFNGLPGAVTPDFWAHQYDQQANQVLVSNAEREWSTNPGCANIYGLSPHYPCCLFSMHRGFPNYVRNMWMATPDDGLIAVGYGPCRVTARVAAGSEVTVVEETDYPFDGAVRLTVRAASPVRFPLHLRIPSWAEGAKVRVGSRERSAGAGSVLRLERTWKPGDIVEIEFPMGVRTERRYNGSTAVLRGPLYYVLRIGKEFRRVVTTDYYCVPNRFDFMGAADWEIRPTTAWNYGLVLDPAGSDLEVKVERRPVTRFPWSDVGDIVFDGEAGTFRSVDEDAPVMLMMKARRVPGWALKNNSADDPPVSPVLTPEPEEDVVLVPYGCARLRITEFPVVAGRRGR